MLEFSLLISGSALFWVLVFFMRPHYDKYNVAHRLSLSAVALDALARVLLGCELLYGGVVLSGMMEWVAWIIAGSGILKVVSYYLRRSSVECRL